MFHDLDSTLEAILDDPAAPARLLAADVSFVMPDKNYVPDQATVNLFLFEVKENRLLRDPEPIYEVVAGQWQRRQPPLRIDCSYLVTTWSAELGADQVAEEHELLGLTLAWLSRFGTIPPAYLQGSLNNQPYPPPSLVAQLESQPRVAEFWSALGSPPRPALTVVVTIAVDLNVVIDQGPPVVTSEIRMEQIDVPGSQEIWFRIAGTVRDSVTTNPLEGAAVSVVDSGLSTTTDEDGRFDLSPLPSGSFTLRTVVGATTQDEAILIPATAVNGYDVDFVI
jgi:hypothetical protein